MIRWLILLMVLAAPARAQMVDYVTTWGKVSDEDFYRLITCGAAPGGECRVASVRWPPERAVDIRIRLEPAPKGFDAIEARLMAGALDSAIAQLNNAGARLALRRVGASDAADIRVFLTTAGDQEPISGTGYSGIDGTIIGAGLTNIWWDDQNYLTEGVIVMAADLPESEILPVMLEELTQSLGLLTDIRNPRYEDFSVFSEDSNRVRFLGGQDLTVIRRHYPGTVP